jgi:catechol-2,3-dioxygenase
MKVEKLILQSHNLPQQLTFYVKKLGFELLEKRKDFFSIKVGKSTLIFRKSNLKSYYHFAFNVPPFQIEEALNWAKRRVTFLEYQGKAIIDFINWNAKAFYFFDEDNNIVEFIDRRNLGKKNDESFSIKSILEISEIGLPVKNIRQAFEKLNKQAGVQKYSGNLENFCAAGDEHGLFIIVDQKTKNWLPTELPAKAFPFELNFNIGGEKFYLSTSLKFGLNILSQKKN